MDIFSDFLRLQLNRAKSISVGFGLSTKESRCARHLVTPIGTLPLRYLGVPLADRRLRVQGWQPVIDKVDARFGGWRARLLSHEGQLVLVKAVLSAIPTYFMLVFRMPAGVRQRLDGAMRSSFWRGSDVAKGGALVAWSTVCRSVAHNGLGVRHLQHTNTALLSKWVIRVMKPSNDMVSIPLREVYEHSLDWSVWATPRRGESLDWSVSIPLREGHPWDFPACPVFL